jgi:hypothetical protein
MQSIEEHGPIGAEAFAELSAARRPFVMRGIANDWPLVEAGKRSPYEAFGVLERLDAGRPADVMVAPPEVRGRFFYGPDVVGFNFERRSGRLAEVAQRLIEVANSEAPPAIYAGANETRVHFPNFDATHPLPHAAMQRDAKSRVWLSNRSEVATHFDLSDNIAVVALGRRRFTLFPPEATGDLYVGPLNHTLAGQPVSMVDPLNPDLERYPRYAAAREVGMSAELAPGDALFIPTLWWHHVQALDSLNLLVNYWYNDIPRGGPFLAFVHSLWAIRDLPEADRRGWQAWFEHFVFAEDAPHASDHLPEAARGVNGGASPARSEMIRQFILRVLAS